MPAAVYVLTIGGVTKTPMRGSLSLTETINGRATIDFEVDSLNGTYRPAMDEDVVLTENGNRIFGGTVNKPSEAGFGGTAGASAITTRVSAVDYNALADRRYQVGGGFPAGTTLKSALTSLVGLLTTYGVTLDGAQVTGPNLPTIVYDVKRLTDIFDELSTITGYIWEIDYSKVLRMYLPGALSAPFGIAEGAGGNAIGDITVEPTRNDYANRIIVLAGDGDRAISDALGTGNGVTTTFTLNYPLITSNGYVTNAGVNETLGVGATWTYNAGTNAVTRSTAPANGNAIVMPYTAQFPIRVQSPLVAAEPTAEQTAHKLWEKVIALPDVFDKALAQAWADAHLARAVASSKIIHFPTEGLGLKRGQLIAVTSTKRNLSGSFLIQEIRSTNPGSGVVLRRDVTAISGTVLQTMNWRNTIKQWSTGSASGASVVNGTVTLAESGFFPDDVVANTGKTAGTTNESALTGFANSQVNGAAVRLGRVADATTWDIVANDKNHSPAVPALAFVNPSTLAAGKYQFQFYIPFGATDTAYLTPDGGGGGALYLGAPAALLGAGYRITNLHAIDVDVINGLHEHGRAAAAGDWTAFTPAWTALTAGNGTVIAKYAQVGKITLVDVVVIFGSTTAVTGSVFMSLPASNTGVIAAQTLGDVGMFDNSASAFYAGHALVSTATVAAIFTNGTPLLRMAAAEPFAWAVNDQLHISLCYQEP